MNIVVVGAHPDDPECGCGGLSIKAADEGHRVIFLYLSSGKPRKMIDGRWDQEIREEEARAACVVCRAEPHFLRYPDGDIRFNPKSVKRLSDFMREVDANLVLAHWPVDTHSDHQAAGALATQVVVGNPGVALAYFEVCTGAQTFAFEPNGFVDISDVAVLKKKAVECHASQEVSSWWHYNDTTECFRGAQIGGDRAEAYCLAVGTTDVETLFKARTRLNPLPLRRACKNKHGRGTQNVCL